MQDSINKQRWEQKKLRRKQKNKTKYVSLLLAFKPWWSWKTKQKKKSHLNKQTLEPNFYNDSVQIRKLTTICRRINRKSAVHSCLVLSALLHYTDNNNNIVRRMKFMEKNRFFSEFPKQHDYFDTRRRQKKETRKVQTKIENQKHRNINQLHMFEFVWTTSLLVMFLDHSPCLIYLILPYYCESTHWIHKKNIKQANPKKNPTTNTIPQPKHHPTFSHF